MAPDNTLRKLYKEFHKNYFRAFDEWFDSGQTGPSPSINLPEELYDLRCGAKTRAGTPCKRKDIYRSTRCRYHGGLSTGPRTEEGKKRSAANWKKRWRKM